MLDVSLISLSAPLILSLSLLSPSLSLTPQTISNVLLSYSDIISNDFTNYCSKEKVVSLPSLTAWSSCIAAISLSVRKGFVIKCNSLTISVCVCVCISICVCVCFVIYLFV